MKFTIYSYYTFCIAIFSAVVIAVDFELGWRCFLFLGINVVALYFTRSDYKIPAFIFMSTMFLSYILRGFIISQDFSEFTMSHVYQVNRDIIRHAFDQSLIVMSVYLFGLFIASTSWSNLKPKSTIKNKSAVLVDLFWLVAGVLLVLLVLKLTLYYGLGLGRKGIENVSPVAFLLRFVPLDLPFVVTGLYFFKYAKALSFQQKLILVLLMTAFSFSVLITGSKSFIMIIAVAYGVYLLYTNTKVRLSHFMSLLALGLLLTVASFALSRAVKFTFFVPNLTFSQVMDMSLVILKEESKTDLLKEVTARFNGFDGQIKLEGVKGPKYQLEYTKLKSAFRVDEIMMRVIEGIVPKLELTDSEQCGVAIGRHAEQVPKDRVYAGALGIVGASQLGGGRLYILFIFMLGALSGIYFKLIRFVKNDDLKFIYFFFGCFFVMNLAMSGNFDALLIQFIVKFVITSYSALFVYMLYNSRRLLTI